MLAGKLVLFFDVFMLRVKDMKEKKKLDDLMSKPEKDKWRELGAAVLEALAECYAVSLPEELCTETIPADIKAMIPLGSVAGVVAALAEAI